MSDHFYAVIDPRGTNISRIMQRLKIKFAGLYRSRYGLRKGRVWQNRFWDHVIRDQNDLNRHLDYIHYNPVKHGLCADPFMHNHSSLHKFAEQGYYDPNWGTREPAHMNGDFGE
jgi:putative transposase